MSSRTRLSLVIAALVLCLGLAIGLVLRERISADNPTNGRDVAVRSLDGLAGQGRIVFRSTALGSTYGRVAVVPLADTRGPRAMLDASCERLDVVSRVSACMYRNDGVVTTYQARLGNADFRAEHDLTIGGLASRTRLSADGTLVATTTFVAGDSYLSSGFSTRTHITEVANGKAVHLEDFAVSHEGSRISPVDRNLWGVTFADDNRTFYVTVAWAGTAWLARGDLVEKVLTTMHSNAECPSLSPDGTRLAYKKRVGPAESPWRFAVMDLRTGAETLTAEKRSVDDQVVWVDRATLAYSVSRAGSGLATSDVWTVPADGTGEPILLIPDAFSPAVLRS